MQTRFPYQTMVSLLVAAATVVVGSLAGRTAIAVESTGMATVTYFEIPVVQLDRAIAFYESVFDTQLQREDIDGNRMALFPDVNGSGMITGALAQGDSYQPSMDGSRVYFSVNSIEQTLARVDAAGGRVVYPRTAIGELGWVAEFRDSEGNRIAVHELPADD